MNVVRTSYVRPVSDRSVQHIGRKRRLYAYRVRQHWEERYVATPTQRLIQRHLKDGDSGLGAVISVDAQDG